MDRNLSFIIDYLYQTHIENTDVYIECIYDVEMLRRSNYKIEDNIVSRYKDNTSLPSKYEYKPYKINDYIIKRLSNHIEITTNNYTGVIISDLIYDVKLTHESILYYDQNKLLLNNSFESELDYKSIKKEVTTLDILNHLRRFYDKRN